MQKLIKICKEEALNVIKMSNLKLVTLTALRSVSYHRCTT